MLATDSRNYIAGLTVYRYAGTPTRPAASQGVANRLAAFASTATRTVNDAQQLAADIDALKQRWRTLAAPVRKNSAADPYTE